MDSDDSPRPKKSFFVFIGIIVATAVAGSVWFLASRPPSPAYQFLKNSCTLLESIDFEDTSFGSIANMEYLSNRARSQIYMAEDYDAELVAPFNIIEELIDKQKEFLQKRNRHLDTYTTRSGALKDLAYIFLEEADEDAKNHGKVVHKTIKQLCSDYR